MAAEPIYQRHNWIVMVFKDFRSNPRTQIRFHFAMMVFWMVNAVAGVVVAVLWPHIWITIGVLYVFLLSIYANWDTDYGAVSAAQASRGTELLAVVEVDQEGVLGEPC